MQRNKIKQQHKNRLLSKANYILLRRLLHCWNGSLNLVNMDFMWAHLHFAQNLSSVTQKASTPKYLAMGNKANLRDLIAATGLVILLKFDPNHQFFSPWDLEIWCMTSKNNRAPLLYYIKLCVSFQIHRLNSNWSYTPETLNLGRNWRYFVPCDLEIWWMTLENDRAPLLYYIKLCASFQIHRWIQTGVTVQKHSIWVKIGKFLSRVTLKFDECPWKTIGHLFYVASSFVQHFKAISEFKLKLQSGKAQSGSNLTIFKAVRPWNLTDELAKQWGTSSMLLQALCIISYPLVNSNLSYSPETLNSGQKWRLFEPCDLEILRMTLKNNRASLLSYFKLCAAFQTHWWIQTGVTVRKRPIWVKFDDF